MSTIRSFFKDTAIYGLSSILPRLINFALVGVYTDVLNTSQFSEQTTWYIYAAFLNVILTLGVETAFLRFYSQSIGKEGIQKSSMALLLVSSLAFCILGLTFAESIGKLTNMPDIDAVRILVWITVLDTMVVIPFVYLRITGQTWRYFSIKMFNIALLVIATLMLLIVLPKGLKSAPALFAKPQVIHIFIANLIASACTLLIMVPLIWKVGIKWDKKIISKLLQYGWPIMVGGLAFVVNENLDKLIIPSFIDKNTNGIYSACYKLSVFMTLYITAFRLGAEPFFFNQYGKDDAEKSYSTIMTWFVIIGSVFMLFVVVFLDVFAGIFLRQNVYHAGLYIVPILLLANLFSGIYNNLSVWYKLTDRTRMGMLISVIGAGLTAISLVILVPFLGMLGGALATLVTYTTMACLSAILGKKWYPVPYEWQKISVIIGASLVLSLLHFYVFRGNLLVGITLLLTYTMSLLWIQKVNLSAIKSILKIKS